MHKSSVSRAWCTLWCFLQLCRHTKFAHTWVHKLSVSRAWYPFWGLLRFCRHAKFAPAVVHKLSISRAWCTVCIFCNFAGMQSLQTHWCTNCPFRVRGAPFALSSDSPARKVCVSKGAQIARSSCGEAPLAAFAWLLQAYAHACPHKQVLRSPAGGSKAVVHAHGVVCICTKCLSNCCPTSVCTRVVWMLCALAQVPGFGRVPPNLSKTLRFWRLRRHFIAQNGQGVLRSRFRH